MAEKHEKQIAPGDPVAALREQLRNGRASSAGEAAGGNFQIGNRAAGTGIQTISGDGRPGAAHGGGPGGDPGRVTPNKRSSAQVAGRERPPAGRSGESNGGSDAGNTATQSGRTAGRLEREDDIPIRKPDPEL